ncbi:hypothetical protein [Halobacillus sp. B23F22_1]|uniref:hypothetical protein n=1 Tax=Halobacillus sp. B23F22_1 TaxID=3459514 RepID=UPI00373E808A
MSASIEFYVNEFKSRIMNYMVSSVPRTLETVYEQIKEELIQQDDGHQELKYLEQAYVFVHKEIVGKQLVLKD